MKMFWYDKIIMHNNDKQFYRVDMHRNKLFFKI